MKILRVIELFGIIKDKSMYYKADIIFTCAGFLYGSFHINITGSNLFFLGKGTCKYRNGSNVIETCK
jgi:hypothetical protein